MTTHGESKRNPFYRKWWHIRSRCVHKWDKDFARYGGRDIKFEWKTYLDFKKDMYASYLRHVAKHGDDTTIERKDVNGNYCKSNCKWTTNARQSLNRRTSRFLVINGVKKNYSEWAREIGCSRQALRYRVIKGMKPSKILKTPFLHSNRYAIV